MNKYIDALANSLLGSSYKDLEKQEQNVIDSIAEAEPIAENVK